MLHRVAEIMERPQGQSAAAAGGGDRGSDPVPAMADRRQFHLHRHSRLCYSAARIAILRRCPTARSASCARRTCRCCGATISRSTITPQIRAFLEEPKPLIVTKANVRSRVHRRVYLDYIGVKRFDADGQADRRTRIVGLFTSTAYTRSARTIPYLRRKVDAILDPRGLRSGRAFRQGAGQCAGNLSARRAVPDRRGHALSICAAGPAARRAAARARAGAPRPFRPFRVGAGVSAARPLRRPHAREDRRLSGRASTRAGSSAFYLFFPEGPLVRIHFIIGRSEGETPDPDRAELGRSGVGDRAHLDRRAGRCSLAAAYEPDKARDAVRALPQRFLRRLSAKPIPPAIAVEDIRIIEGLSAERPLSVDFHRRPATTRSIGLKVWSYGARRSRSPARAGAGKYGLPRRRRAHLSDRARRRRRARGLVPRHAAGTRGRRAGRARAMPRSGWKRCSWW